MNYLAHAVIGGGASRPDVLVGNFIGDAVKGSAWRAYLAGVQEGILLHRAIDAEADAHPAAVESRALLRPRFGKMAGVALDLLHDHFLAQTFHAHEVHPGGLAAFAREVEGVLSARAAEMPERSQRFLQGLALGKPSDGKTHLTINWVERSFAPTYMRGGILLPILACAEEYARLSGCRRVLIKNPDEPSKYARYGYETYRLRRVSAAYLCKEL